MARMTPDIPPSRNVTRNPTDHTIGVLKSICPPHMVPIQLKNLIPVGTAIRSDRALKYGSSTPP